MAVGTNDATSWSFHDVAESSSAAVPVWPATVAVDEQGRVFVAWHDNRNAFVQRSDDGGEKWTPPVAVNAGGTAVYPTVAAGGGYVDVSWFGTDTTGDANDANVMGAPGAPGAAQWSVRWARSKDDGATFKKRATADALVHTGVLCTKGTACTISNSRDLLDDFAAVIDPATGRAVIVYTTDQPGGTRANRSIRAARANSRR
jgi:hypothetical protein